MKSRNLLSLLIFFALLPGCKDNPTTQVSAPERSLSLSSNVNNVASPVDITFTGTFHAYSDTSKMHVPDMFLMGAPTRTIVRYILPDTSTPAKRTYTSVQQFSSAGTYSIYMVLQTMQGDVFSDTLAIVVH